MRWGDSDVRGEESEKVWGEVAYARDLVLMTPRLPRLSQRSPPTPPQQPQLLCADGQLKAKI